VRLVGSSVKFIIARFSQKKHDNGRLQFSVKILSLDNYVTYIYTHYIYIHIYIYTYNIYIYVYRYTFTVYCFETPAIRAFSAGKSQAQS